MPVQLPSVSDADLAKLAFSNLASIVAIDSQSDESSPSIPSTDGQRILADFVGDYFATLGATVERDAFANVIATFEGRGDGIGAPPLALMVHLDTARGTEAVDDLKVVPAWSGDALSYAENPALTVSTKTYPAVAPFVGQDVVHGGGRAPFGLDDKLGLTHLMTLAWLLKESPTLSHPPLLLIGRPDEEIGRMEAVEGLAKKLAERGVTSGYTVDGILPFEVNLENFNGAHARLTFRRQAMRDAPTGLALDLFLGGVNTHGCTAKAEGHRPATRFAAEICAALAAASTHPDGAIRVVSFESDAIRDCDARLVFQLADPALRTVLEDACQAVIGPHIPRGASWRVVGETDVDAAPTDSAERMLTYVSRLLSSRPGFPVAAEESEGREGYSQPYRALGDAGTTILDVRIRDFETAGIAVRKTHVRSLVTEPLAVQVLTKDQYINMGPQMESRRDLVEQAMAAGEALGVDVTEQPIRGGTGVDPFISRGVYIANLGTGYFAPESEKELTSVQMMAEHAKWLAALVQLAARGPDQSP